VDDFVVNALIQDSKGFLKDIKVWGCNRVEGKWAALDKKRASGVRVYGIETEAL
jgi:DNA repair protein RAD7